MTDTKTKTTATCSVCLRSFKVLKNGRIARHGFKVHNRGRGQLGCAWQTGACAGMGFPTYEESTEGTEWALERVRAFRAEELAALDALDAKAPLLWTPGLMESRWGVKPIRVEAGTGQQFPKVADLVEGWSGNPHKTVRVSSYDLLWQNARHALRQSLQAADGDIQTLEAAIAAWRPAVAA